MVLVLYFEGRTWSLCVLEASIGWLTCISSTALFDLFLYLLYSYFPQLFA